MTPKKNQVFKVEIQDVTNEGAGVAKIDGLAVFVKDAVKGDICEILLLKVNKSVAYAKIIKIIKPSKHRVKPLCGYFDKCGGCSFWSMSYALECEIKRNAINQNFKKIGGLNAKLDDFLAADDIINYRNKAQFPVGVTDTGNIKIGFFKKRTHEIIELDKCIIQRDINEKIIYFFKKCLKKSGLSVYNEATNKGLIRHIYTRTGFKTNQLMIVIVINGYSLPGEANLVEDILLNFPMTKSIVLNYNLEKTNTILGRTGRVLYNQDYILDYIGDKVFKISYKSFFQINPAQTRRLYDKALELASFAGDEVLIDLYCGVGTISIYMANSVKKVIGVEIVEDAIKDAEQNAVMNNISNCSFFCGDAKNLTDFLDINAIKADVVIVDPPRKGLEQKAIDIISQEIRPKKVIYISCDSATLSRDLAIFNDKGYKISKSCGVDLFPRTSHVECVVLITRVKD